jgi:hypothetical protein
MSENGQVFTEILRFQYFHFFVVVTGMKLDTPREIVGSEELLLLPVA